VPDVMLAQYQQNKHSNRGVKYFLNTLITYRYNLAKVCNIWKNPKSGKSVYIGSENIVSSHNNLSRNMIKVGFQGICGSNSEIAAENLTRKMGLSNVEFVGLVTSKAVIEALEKGLIDYGVLATKNSIGGEVKDNLS